MQLPSKCEAKYPGIIWTRGEVYIQNERSVTHQYSSSSGARGSAVGGGVGCHLYHESKFWFEYCRCRPRSTRVYDFTADLSGKVITRYVHRLASVRHYMDEVSVEIMSLKCEARSKPDLMNNVFYVF